MKKTLRIKILAATIMAFLFVASLSSANEERSDAERIVGVWVVEMPYGSDKVHYEYEFRDDGTFRQDKWYLDKDNLPYNRSDNIKNKIDKTGKYYFEKTKERRDLLIIKHAFSKGGMVDIVYRYRFEDDNTLKTTSHRGRRHKRKWTRKESPFEWR